MPFLFAAASDLLPVRGGHYCRPWHREPGVYSLRMNIFSFYHLGITFSLVLAYIILFALGKVSETLA